MRSAGRPYLVVSAALLALGIIAAMALTGGPPGRKYFASFEAFGLSPKAPEQIIRVELATKDRRLVFARTAGGEWAAEQAPGLSMSTPLSSRLGTALHFLHVSAPTRVMRPEEYDGVALAEFGLDPPRYVVSLFARDTPVLKAACGSLNPMRTSQYVHVEGREELYLMPDFIGREWEIVAEGTVGSAGRVKERSP